MNRIDLLTILLFHTAMLTFGSNFKIVKYVFIVILLLFLLSKIRTIINRFRDLNIALAVFTFAILVSGLYARQHFSGTEWYVSPTSSLLFAAQTAVFFLFFEYAVIKNYQRRVLKVFTATLGFYLLLADLYIFSKIGSITDGEGHYLVGSKFMISYMHMLLSCLVATMYKNKTIFGCLIVLTLFISKTVYCSTAVVGTLVLVVLVFARIAKKYLYSYWTLASAIGLSFLFMIFVEIVIANPMFSRMLDALGENSTLTGRTAIYGIVLDIFVESPWWGHGNGSGPGIISYYLDYGNAQNGIMEDLIEWGVVGTLCMLIFLFVMIIKLPPRKNNYYLLCMLYIYIIMGTVEITMGRYFLIAMAMYFVTTYYNSSKRQHTIKGNNRHGYSNKNN